MSPEHRARLRRQRQRLVRTELGRISNNYRTLKELAGIDDLDVDASVRFILLLVQDLERKRKDVFNAALRAQASSLKSSLFALRDVARKDAQF